MRKWIQGRLHEKSQGPKSRDKIDSLLMSDRPTDQLTDGHEGSSDMRAVTLPFDLESAESFFLF